MNTYRIEVEPDRTALKLIELLEREYESLLYGIGDRDISGIESGKERIVSLQCFGVLGCNQCN